MNSGPGALLKVGGGRAALGFLILFAFYQSAEGVGQRILGSFAAQAVLMVVCVLSAWPVGRYILEHRGYDAYGLEWQRAVPLWLTGGFLLALLAKLLLVYLGFRLGAYSISFPESPPAATSRAAIVALTLVSTFIPSLAEDIITRGFWWRVSEERLRGATFVLVTSLVYVLNHVFRLANGPSEWLMLFCFGVAYAVAVVRTGSLWAAVGVHWGWNLSNALLESFTSIKATSQLTPLLSAAAHLLMAAVIFSAIPSRSRGDSQRDQAERIG